MAERKYMEDKVKKDLEKLGEGGRGVESRLVALQERREGTTMEGHRGQADVSTDVLEMKARTEAGKIDEIDLGRSVLEQQPNIDLLEGTAVAMLVELQKAGHEIESAQDLLPFLIGGFPDDVNFESDIEQAALRKFAEMKEKPNAEVTEHFRIKIETFIAQARQMREGGQAIIDEFAKQPAEEASPPEKITVRQKAPEKKESEIRSAAVNFAYKHPIITGVVAVGVAYGAYRLISGFFKESKENKVKKALVLGGVAACGLGLILEKDKVLGWVSNNLGVDFSWNGIKRFMKNFFKGDFEKAFASAAETVKITDLHKKTAAYLGISAEALESLGSAPFEKFSHEVDEYKAQGKSWLIEKILPAIHLGKVFDSKEIIEAQKAEAKLIKFFREHRDILEEGTEPKTIDEALQKLAEKGIIGAPLLPDTDEKEAKKDEPEALAESEEGMKELLENFTEKNAPALAKVIREREFTEDPSDFIHAAWDDKVPIVVGAGKVALWNGYKFITVTSAATLVKTFWEMLQVPFADDSVEQMGVAAKTYWENGHWFLIIGAGTWGGLGLLQGLISGKGVIRGGLSGAFKGLGKGAIMPIEVARLHYVGGKRLYEGASGGRYWVSRVWEKTAESMEREARFHAKMFQKYNTLRLALEGHDPSMRKSVLRKLYVRGVLSTERVEDLTRHYAREFAKDMQRWHAEKGTPLGHLEVSPQEIEDGYRNIKTAAEKLEEDAPKSPAKRSRFSLSRSTASPEFPAKTFAELGEAEKSAVLAKHGVESAGSDAKRFLKEWEAEAMGKELEKKPYNALEPEFAASRRLEELKDLAGGGKRFSFRGMAIDLTAEELKVVGDRPQALYEMCFGKWRTRAMAALSIEETRVRDGRHEYKLRGGEFREALDTDGKPLNADAFKRGFLKEIEAQLVKEGENADEALKKAEAVFEKIAKKDGLMSYLPRLPMLFEVLGKAATYMMIYHLETAPDKKQALVKLTVDFGAFLAGSKMTERTLGKHIDPVKHPIFKVAVDFAGGLFAAWGFGGPNVLAEMVDKYLLDFTGAHAAAGETVSLFEKWSARTTSRLAFRGLATETGKKVLGKAGLEVLSSKVESEVMKSALLRVEKLAAKQGISQILKMLGWRGVTAAALLADNVTVIGVLDDIVAVGFGVWMAKDIADMVLVVRNALAVKEAMVGREGSPISSISIKDAKVRANLQKRFETLGVSSENAGELGEDRLFDIVRGEDDVTLVIERAGVGGKEEWHLKNGDAVGIKILDEKGGVLAEVSGLDAAKIDEMVQSLEKYDKKAA